MVGGGPLHLLVDLQYILILSQDLLFTLICWQCLHHGFGNLHTSQFVGGLFARFAGISLGPDPQGTRQQDTKQHHHTGQAVEKIKKKKQWIRRWNCPWDSNPSSFFFFFREKLMYLSPDPENEKKGRSNTQGWQRESYPKF